MFIKEKKKKQKQLHHLPPLTIIALFSRYLCRHLSILFKTDAELLAKLFLTSVRCVGSYLLILFLFWERFFEEKYNVFNLFFNIEAKWGILL